MSPAAAKFCDGIPHGPTRLETAGRTRSGEPHASAVRLRRSKPRGAGLPGRDRRAARRLLGAARSEGQSAPRRDARRRQLAARARGVAARLTLYGREGVRLRAGEIGELSDRAVRAGDRRARRTGRCQSHHRVPHRRDLGGRRRSPRAARAATSACWAAGSRRRCMCVPSRPCGRSSRLRVFSPTAANREAFARRFSEELGVAVPRRGQRGEGRRGAGIVRRRRALARRKPDPARTLAARRHARRVDRLDIAGAARDRRRSGVRLRPDRMRHSRRGDARDRRYAGRRRPQA